ncbi:uncharacterized protein LOC113514497 [Galleria mellonella]|uniref:Uncharacterized protein LOC113514497 n=1 Tax=Galleria mellonella TaxID=7137 RepID=A0ABM3MNA4_GALME|nr:uncharacterized protein LOC113514497 [Galleria mellonella]XP_052752838.1 uncharacterized protein LOC113514497 [Galleria mellonella]
MDESEDNMSSDGITSDNSLMPARTKPKKRSLVERELETNLTARVTSPITKGDGLSTSRYGRARRFKSDTEFSENEKIVIKAAKSPSLEKTPVKVHSPVYKMHASNSPIKLESPKTTPKIMSLDSSLDNQIENIYNENMSLSRFGSEEKKNISPTNKVTKVYVRKDLIQNRDKDDNVTLIKHMFSPVKSASKSNNHLSNILERSSEKYGLNSNAKSQQGYASVVKTLDFDVNKKKKKENRDVKNVLSKNELFDLEAKCEYQVGDLAWARMGTYPFWPCIITREPFSDMFVKKKLFGRIERDVIHVTFFGDNGRRSWIVDSMLRKFLGQLEFEATREQFSPSAKKKDPRFYSAFFVSEKKLPQWNKSVEEAEILLREPKRLRIDILNDMLLKERALKCTPKHNRSGKITRTDSDVSLSESLYDTLFSEDDGKPEDCDRSRNKSRNKSLDVSEVVTACLDNMAAKTGITKIQRQSHMDRWLQKAKSKTPEKSQGRVQVLQKETKSTILNSIRNNSNSNKKIKSSSKPVMIQKPYSLRKSDNLNENVLCNHNDHDYSTICNIDISTLSSSKHNENADSFDQKIHDPIDSIVMAKVENHSDKEHDSDIGHNNKMMQSSTETETLNEDIENFDSNSHSNNTKSIYDDIKVSVNEMDTTNFNDSQENISILKDDSQSSSSNLNYDSDRNYIQLKNESQELKEENLLSMSCLEKDGYDNVDSTKISFCDEENPSNILNLEKNYQGSHENISNLRKDSETNMNKSNYIMNENDDHKNIDNSKISCSTKEKLSCLPNSEDNYRDVPENISDSRKDSETNNKSNDLINEMSHEIVNEFNNNNTSDMESVVVNNETNSKISIVGENVCYVKYTNVNSSNDLSNEKGKQLINNCSNNEMDGDITNYNMKQNLNANEVTSIDPCAPHFIQNGDIGVINTEQDITNQNCECLYGVTLESNNIDSSDIYNKIINGNQEFLDVSENYTKDLDVEESGKELTEINDVTHQNGKHLLDTELESHINNASDVFKKVVSNNQESSSISEIHTNVLSVTKPIIELPDNTKVTTNIMKINDIDLSIDLNTIKNTISTKIVLEEVESKSNMEISIDENTAETNVEGNIIDTLKNECCVFNSSVQNIRSTIISDTDFAMENVETIGNKDFFAKNKEINVIDKQADDGKNEVDDNMDNICSYSIHDFYKNVNKDNNFTNLTNEFDLDKNLVCKDQLCSGNNQLNNVEICSLNNESENVANLSHGTIPITNNSLNISTNDIAESSKVNGYHESAFNDCLDTETSSINSEDNEPLSVTRNKLKKFKEKVNKLENPEFLKYLDIKLDDLIVEYPDLSRDEIVEYLYKTWEYEQNLKSDFRKTDEIKQTNMIKGLSNQEAIKEIKITGKVKNEKVANKSLTKNKTKRSLKHWLYQQISELPNKFMNEIDATLGTTSKINNITELDSAKLEDIETKVSHNLESVTINPLNTELVVQTDEKIKLVNLGIKLENDLKDDNIIKTFVNDESEENYTKPDSENIYKENRKHEIKDDLDSETISIHSEDSDISISKRKRVKTAEKSGFNFEDPEFVKYLELRQDALIDENPQLTQAEITLYLYKTWLYEESVKSEIKKNDEINESNLIKGLKHDTPPKKVRKKIKAEKEFIVDDVTFKDKPKRKTSQPYYNEEYSDVDEELEIFEIRSKPKYEISKLEKTNEVQTEVVELDEDEVDEVELYFEELTKPKPNLFKGLIREKVCEICEKTNNLIKCKGCNNMYHIDCVRKAVEIVEVPIPSRGRKKKKKVGRKSKNLEDSGSHSDERSQDLSDDHNMSIEDIIAAEPRVVDAESFEAQLADKMKEILDSNNQEYDSYSSDDGVDWSTCVAGKCEIVDVKLKPKKENIDYSDFKCNDCQKYDIPVCFVCKQAVSKTGVEYRQKCQVAHCYKYYHIECLVHWPQTQFSSGEILRNKKKNEQVEALSCPRHVCHTCVSDDPRGCKTRFSGDKLARCVRCPATYHTFTKCLPAGSQILTGSLIICPRHYEHRPGKVPCHVNTGWCFICALGGTLICCEYCPTSFHAECLNIKPPEGGYMCEDCETGRLPLYGEMVWVKLGHYRWWPGLILHPSEIPDNIMAVKHSPGEFVVRFFGQYDYYWVNRGRVFPFQEGDSGKISSQKSKIDAAFTTAIEHAQRACEILKAAQPNEEESMDIASSLLPPHYVKLKVNKPCGSLCGKRIDIEESSLTQCDCNPDEEDPCGPYSQCLNRMLLTECGPSCRAGDRCNNRAFEKRLYPKLVPYRTPQRGWGLKTLEDIRAGQFVIEYVGELIDEDEFKRRMNRKHEIRDENFYFLTLDKERMIDAGPKGNLARFMNHCCEPNCETQKWTVLGDVRVGLFAINDIPANSEVTFNYNLECAGIDKKRCLCGAKRCSGYIGAKPKQNDTQQKKPKVAAKRAYNKRKKEESPSVKNKSKRPIGRPAKPRELTEIEKDLLIIKNATNGLSSDSECSRLSSLEGDRNQKASKRKRVSFSTEDIILNGKNSPSVKKIKLQDDKSSDLD